MLWIFLEVLSLGARKTQDSNMESWIGREIGREEEIKTGGEAGVRGGSEEAKTSRLQLGSPVVNFVTLGEPFSLSGLGKNEEDNTACCLSRWALRSHSGVISTLPFISCVTLGKDITSLSSSFLIHKMETTEL